MLDLIMVPAVALATALYGGWHGHPSECSAAWPQLVACISIAEGVAEDRAWREEMPVIAPQVFCYFWAGATIDDKPHLKGKGSNASCVATLIRLMSLGRTTLQVSIEELPQPVHRSLSSVSACVALFICQQGTKGLDAPKSDWSSGCLMSLLMVWETRALRSSFC